MGVSGYWALMPILSPPQGHYPGNWTKADLIRDRYPICLVDPGKLKVSENDVCAEWMFEEKKARLKVAISSWILFLSLMSVAMIINKKKKIANRNNRPIDMTSNYRISLQHVFGALGLVCVACFFWLSAAPNGKGGGESYLIGLYAMLAAVAIGGAAPIFPMLVRRISVGIFAFITILWISFEFWYVVLWRVYEPGLFEDIPAWIRISSLVVSGLASTTLAVYLSFSCTQPQDANAPRGS